MAAIGTLRKSFKSQLPTMLFAALGTCPHHSLGGAEGEMRGLGEKLSRGKESYQAKRRGCISQIRETANWFSIWQLELSMETVRAEANRLTELIPKLGSG